MKGLLFETAEIGRVVKDIAPWIHVDFDKELFVEGNGNFDAIEIGTKLEAQIVGVKKEYDEDHLDLYFRYFSNYSPAKSLVVSVSVNSNEMIDETFKQPYFLTGVVCECENGTYNFMNTVEKEFKSFVEELFDGRTDRYAQEFLKFNVKTLHDREHILLHMLKNEMKYDETLRGTCVKPEDLMVYFANITEQCSVIYQQLEKMENRLTEIVDKLKTVSDKNEIKNLTREQKMLERDIENKKNKKIYYRSIITDVIEPILYR